MTVDQYQKWYFKKHGLYERKALSLLNNFVRKNLANVELSPVEYKNQLELYLPSNQLKEVLKEVYKSIGLLHGNRIEKGLNSGILAVKSDNPYNLSSLFSERWFNLVNSFFEDHYNRIVTIRQNLIQGVIDIISKNLKEGKGIAEITKDLVKNFGRKTGLYSWQMRRIARTESNTASSMASFEAFDNSNLVVNKVWISALDERTRESHRILHGIEKPLNEGFETFDKYGNTEILQMPSDINASPENSINCRCTLAPKIKLDEFGLPVLKRNLNN